MRHTTTLRLRRTALAAVFTVAAGAALAAPAAQYTVEAVYDYWGSPVYSYGIGVADDGRTLINQEQYGNPRGPSALVCEGANQCTVLGLHGDNYAYGRARRMGPQGWVTGYKPYYGSNQAFLYDGAEYRVMNQMPGSDDSEGWGINASGVVVGHLQADYGAPTRAFRWEGQQSGVGITELGTLGGVSSSARAINAGGAIAGFSQRADGRTHAFLYRKGQMNDLGTLGGGDSWAHDINDRGVVVGCSQQAGTAPQAGFVYRLGQMRPLSDPDGGTHCAVGINNSGVIVGWSQRQGQVKPVAVRYRNGRAVDLNTVLDPVSGAGWVLHTANAVNAQGQIVGSGTLNGEQRAFVLTPMASAR